ncbi:MAG: hypothetical protein HY260_02200 [Chloroflexi bacterium]|nr:hypothetical protein [Chloroflexota bacterium]
MPRRSFFLLPLFLLPFISLACNLPSLSPVRRFTQTPHPTLSGSTSTPELTAPLPPTETPLGIFAPSATPTLNLSITPTDTETPTPTLGSGSSTTTGSPLTITDVRLIAVRRDATRDNGAIATVEILFTGCAPPYTFADEHQFKPGNPFEVATTCAAGLVHTATVTSADGQADSKPYSNSANASAGSV